MAAGQYGDRVLLPAWDGSSEHSFTPVVSMDDDRARNRVVDLWSRSRAPWLARVSWSIAGQVPNAVLITVPASTRFTVRARTVRVEAANLHNAANAVGCAIAGNAGTTRYDNVYEVPHPGTGDVDIPVPDFATRVRLELQTPASLATAFIKVFDAAGTLRSRVDGDEQPAEGVWLGAASTLTVGSQVPGRVLFPLQL